MNDPHDSPSVSDAPAPVATETDAPASAASAAASDADARAKKQDILTPSPSEARELERFIDSGHNSSGTIAGFTFLGILFLFCGLLYWDKLDLYQYNEKWMLFGSETLPFLVENQARQERNAYRLQPGVENPPATPAWPQLIYKKMRMDMYVLAGLCILICWVLLRIERAKSRRNDLLAFRALAREVEKLRLRVRELEDLPENEKPKTQNPATSGEKQD